MTYLKENSIGEMKQDQPILAQFDNQDFTITITPSAIKRLQQMKIELEMGKKLRISVEGGGCSGFRYNYDFIENMDLMEDYYIAEQGIEVVINKSFYSFLNGMVLNFVEELGNQYFEIKNPNANMSCGCGNSFNVY